MLPQLSNENLLLTEETPDEKQVTEEDLEIQRQQSSTNFGERLQQNGFEETTTLQREASEQDEVIKYTDN